MSKWQIAFTLSFSVLFFLVLLFMLKALSLKDLEAEKENTRNFRDMASTDSMTGVRNKHAYSETEAYLNHRIRQNDIEKLAVVVCDINGLKLINDTQGHAAGDKLIKDAGRQGIRLAAFVMLTILECAGVDLPPVSGNQLSQVRL